MRKFEYTIVELPGKSMWTTKINYTKLMEELNALGMQGWEVVSHGVPGITYGTSRQAFIILKREIN